MGTSQNDASFDYLSGLQRFGDGDNSNLMSSPDLKNIDERDILNEIDAKSLSLSLTSNTKGLNSFFLKIVHD